MKRHPTEIIDSKPEELVAQAYVESVLGVQCEGPPTRETAEQMLCTAMAIFTVLDGRPTAAAYLRSMADRIEHPETSGTA